MNITATVFKLLGFQLSREEMLQFKNKHFLIGLLGTWIVGMGRYWDDPKASLLQHMGLGSVIYIFLLAAFIWIIILPFRVNRWNYFTVLTFVSLTSFPAIFYAIPVERFTTMSTANSINVWFLAIVASWRLGLLFYFIKRYTRLSSFNIITLTLMPICVIITTLFALNLHGVVFQIMGGLEKAPTPHDASYAVLMTLTLVSVLLVIPLLIAYGAGIAHQRDKEKRRKASTFSDL